MQIKIDESVLRKTDVFCRILEDANKRNDIAPDLARGICEEYNAPIPKEDKDAIDKLAGCGVCLRGDYVVKHPKYKTPDVITGGFLAGTKNEVVYLAECKFNAENPGKIFGKSKEFHRLVSKKFQVLDTDIWNIYAPDKKFFVLFPLKNTEVAKFRMRNLQKELEGDELTLVESFIVCDLTEFREYFV